MASASKVRSGLHLSKRHAMDPLPETYSDCETASKTLQQAYYVNWTIHAENCKKLGGSDYGNSRAEAGLVFSLRHLKQLVGRSDCL